MVKYKLYHLAFWFVYHCFWWALTSGSILDAINNIFFSPYSTKFVFYLLFQAFGVYFNLYYLIPKFLQTGKYVTYITLLTLTILTTSACIISGYYVNAFIVEVSFEELFRVAPDEFMVLFKTNALPSTLASMTLAMSIKLTKNWMASERKRNAMQKEKLETELKFLRSQFNPHFLFNTINSIFVLIHKNQDMAQASLAKFSDLLRYQLYQCNEPYIALHKELEYLQNFIELEKLRQETKNLSLDIVVKNESGQSLGIAPFLLIPFVENAFKHVSHHKKAANFIKLHLGATDRQLCFEVINSVGNLKNSSDMDTSGIGLQNVKRRLALMYPESHNLEIYSDDLQFKVSLQLQLSELHNLSTKTA